MGVFTSFKVYIVLGNDAMQTADAIAAALLKIAKNLEHGHVAGQIMDLNGNNVGTYELR